MADNSCFMVEKTSQICKLHLIALFALWNITRGALRPFYSHRPLTRQNTIKHTFIKGKEGSSIGKKSNGKFHFCLRSIISIFYLRIIKDKVNIADIWNNVINLYTIWGSDYFYVLHFRRQREGALIYCYFQ